MELGIRFRVLLPASVGCMHLVLTVVAEVQRKTGWGYIPPGVAIDPSPLPIAEQLAIWLNLPAYIITLAISILTRFPTEGTSLLLLDRQTETSGTRRASRFVSANLSTTESHSIDSARSYGARMRLLRSRGPTPIQ
jgi:hypothetical protein